MRKNKRTRRARQTRSKRRPQSAPSKTVPVTSVQTATEAPKIASGKDEKSKITLSKWLEILLIIAKLGSIFIWGGKDGSIVEKLESVFRHFKEKKD